VKKLEELGIGRPSTYASIIEVLQRRNYVKLDRKRFIPEDRGRIVTAFLQTYFPRYVEYNFTAHLEEELDDISDGKMDWRQVLRDFWQPFSVAVQDWYGANPSAAVVVPYRHIATGRDDTPVSLFTFGVDLAAGKELRSLVLPKVSDGLQSGVPALHIFAMTVN